MRTRHPQAAVKVCSCFCTWGGQKPFQREHTGPGCWLGLQLELWCCGSVSSNPNGKAIWKHSLLLLWPCCDVAPEKSSTSYKALFISGVMEYIHPKHERSDLEHMEVGSVTTSLFSIWELLVAFGRGKS